MIITEKRAVVSFSIFVLIMIVLVWQIGNLSVKTDSAAFDMNEYRTVEIASSRGKIYDKNMSVLSGGNRRTVLAVNPTGDAVKILKKTLTDNEFASVLDKITGGEPFVISPSNYNGECDNCDDIKVLTVYDRYDGNTALHTIGYLDSEMNGMTGIEKSYNDYLKSASGSISVRFPVDATGMSLLGKKIETVDDNYNSRTGVVLTIDKKIQNICEKAMLDNELENGAVVVLDTQTSGISAMASTPLFDRNNISASLNDENSPFLNKALCAYSVGSVFKPVVAAAALKEGLKTDTIYDCTGSVNIGENIFYCHNRNGHGELNMSDALTVSCNSYFIRLGLDVGAKKILDMSSEFGFGKGVLLSDGILSDSGNLPLLKEIDSPQALANLSFGQGTLLATPLQIASMYCIFANGGYYREPYLVKGHTDENGELYAYYKNETEKSVLPSDICEKISAMLYETVRTGSGKRAKPMCCNACGKTATAQTGWYENGSEIVHTWFAGYYPYENPKYVIVVFKENGGASSLDCAPIFKDIADGIISAEN